MKAVLLSIVLCAAMAVSAAQNCETTPCASDELCVSNTCQCNSTFYQNTGAYPSPVVTCDGGKLNVKLSKCLLERNGFNTSNISLRDNTCLAKREVVDGIAQMAFHPPLSSICGTNSSVEDSNIVFKNELYVYSQTVPLLLRKNFVLNISCSLPQNANASLNVTLRPISGNIVITVPGSNATYQVKMEAFKDPDYSILLSETDPLYVEDTIYIAVYIPNLDADSFQLKVLSMYASPNNVSSIKYNILTEGCPSTEVPPGLLKVKKNGQGSEARFEMKVFKIADSDTVSLSADILICNDCVPNCITKSGRSESSLGTVSIALTASDSNVDTSSASSSSWSLSALIFSWILMKLM